MVRSSWRFVLAAAVVAVAVSASSTQANAFGWLGARCGGCGWGCGWDCCSPCAVSCCTPCYTPCYTPCCTPTAYYHAIRPAWACCSCFRGCASWGSPCVSNCNTCGDFGCTSCDGGVSTPTYAPASSVTPPAPATAPTPAKKPTEAAPVLPPEPAPVVPPTTTPPKPATPPATLPGGEIPAVPGGSTSFGPTAEDSGMITVWVPAEAKVTINGLLTHSTGSKRQFTSFGLKPGFSYKYEVRAEIVRNGEIVSDTRTVTLTAGQRGAVAFGFNPTGAEGIAAN